jgi:predicted hydrocarbon binding protein
MPDMPELLRPQLGDFSSIVCFKAVIIGMEDALGDKATAIALITAGRARGKQLAESLGLSGSVESLEQAQAKLSQALGKEGTRLCIIDKIVTDGDTIKAYTSETVCSAGEAQGSDRKCTFTLGAVWGALEQILGKRFRGVHTESVLRGGTYDVFELTPLE